jgi:hypothetical protein
VGLVHNATPSVQVTALSRYRVRTSQGGLNLRAGEIVLCAPYEPTHLGMVVLVHCETDGHSPGALISIEDIDYIGPALEPMAPCKWDTPGTRP